VEVLSDEHYGSDKLFNFTRDAFGSHLLTYSPTLKVDKRKPKHHNQPDYADYDQLEKK
jgi:hypothetical protein